MLTVKQYLEIQGFDSDAIIKHYPAIRQRVKDVYIRLTGRYPYYTRVAYTHGVYFLETYSKEYYPLIDAVIDEVVGF